MTDRRRVLNEPMFLLNQRSYSETSLLLDGFSRHYGRLALIAKGVKQRKSRMRGTLLAFQKLVISWVGKGEIKTVTSVDATEAQQRLTGHRLFCGYYVNELILRMLHRGEAHQVLFDSYESSLNGLLHEKDLERVLRIFEKRLLRELGYGLHLQSDTLSGEPIKPLEGYRYLTEVGPVKDSGDGSIGIIVHGESLNALEMEISFSDLHRRELKQLTRAALDYHLEGRTLHSRAVYGRLFANRDNSILGDIPETLDEVT
jgi:DNA repair protein RecO (recombination protein O)